ncbi:MAG: transcriptional regulator [Candidatus Thorarchaeota archaeon]|nr:MAG: transcriptional regulator [Candidatus Thorarchaeota archaeon]
MSSEDGRQPIEINKLIHEPGRLQIMTKLYVVEEADFIFLMRQTGLTWGNLSSHISKLEDEGYIEVRKEFLGKKPHTVLKMTPGGRKALEEYRAAINKIFEGVSD